MCGTKKTKTREARGVSEGRATPFGRNREPVGNGGKKSFINDMFPDWKEPGIVLEYKAEGSKEVSKIEVTSLGRGLEGAAYTDGKNVFKIYERGTSESRDSQLEALERLYKVVPHLVPKPLGKGVARTDDGDMRPAYVMSKIEVTNSRASRIRKEDLEQFGIDLRAFGSALKETGMSWDASFENVLQTKEGFKFIDVSLGSGEPYVKNVEEFVSRVTSKLVKKEKADVKPSDHPQQEWEESPLGLRETPTFGKPNPFEIKRPLDRKPGQRFFLDPIEDAQVRQLNLDAQIKAEQDRDPIWGTQKPLQKMNNAGFRKKAGRTPLTLPRIDITVPDQFSRFKQPEPLKEPSFQLKGPIGKTNKFFGEI